MNQPLEAPSKSEGCPHSYVRKAYYLGRPGEDYVCVRCGESRPEAEWPDFWKRSAPRLTSR